MTGRTWCGASVIILALFSGVGLGQDDPFKTAINAIEKGEVETIRGLLDRGLDEDAMDMSGNTLLMTAVFKLQPDIVELLLERGASPKIANNGGITPLTIAVASGQARITRLLLNAGTKLVDSKTGENKLSMAVRLGYQEVSKLLLEHGADADKQDASELTPLMVTAAFGNVALAKLLLEFGAEVDKKSERFRVLVKNKNGDVSWWETWVSGMTPLMYAAERGHVYLVGELLKKGAEVSSRDSRGRRARDFAEAGGHSQILALLDSVEAGVALPLGAESEHDSATVDSEPRILSGKKGSVDDSLLSLVHKQDVGFGSRSWSQDPRAGYHYEMLPMDLDQKGTVVVHALIDEQGNVKRAYVSSCSFPFMTVSAAAPALNLTRHMKFSPATRNGKPVERWTWVTQTVCRSRPGSY
jgi:ankyrin repeat protein